MKTITAVDLRNNLDQIVKRVNKGESIRVTYRTTQSFVIQPDVEQSNQPKPGSREAMQKVVKMIEEMNRIPRKSSLDPNMSIKDLYHKMLDEDPKYKGYHAK